jgi:hypothetical protein
MLKCEKATSIYIPLKTNGKCMEKLGQEWKNLRSSFVKFSWVASIAPSSSAFGRHSLFPFIAFLFFDF